MFISLCSGVKHALKVAMEGGPCSLQLNLYPSLDSASRLIRILISARGISASFVEFLFSHQRVGSPVLGVISPYLPSELRRCRGILYTGYSSCLLQPLTPPSVRWQPFQTAGGPLGVSSERMRLPSYRPPLAAVAVLAA